MKMILNMSPGCKVQPDEGQSMLHNTYTPEFEIYSHDLDFILLFLSIFVFTVKPFAKA